MTQEKKRFKNFAEFWPYYLSEHTERGTRLAHVWATLLVLLALIHAIINFSPGWLFLGPIFGYSLAWLSHAMVEKNQPATLLYPFWSLKGDLYMTKLWLSGKLEIELIRLHVEG